VDSEASRGAFVFLPARRIQINNYKPLTTAGFVCCKCLATFSQILFMTHLLLASFMTRGLLITLVIGLIAGLLAQAFTPGRGFGLLASIFLGILGGWLGDKLFTFVHISTDIPYLNQIIRATLGAIVIVLVVNLVVGRDRREKTGWRS
jgi:uncharacterized membrane protein YeaQ/YmgE (transglycosylase-associated protein family)